MPALRRLNLTDKDVAAFKNAPPTGKVERLPDAKVPGLVLYKTPSGTVTWCLRYELAGSGKRVERQAKLADASLSLAQARHKAREAMAAVTLGEDPFPSVRAANQPPPPPVGKDATVSSYWPDFVARHGRAWKPRTAVEYQRLFKTLVEPYLGHRPLAAIDKREVAEWHRLLSTQGDVKGRERKAAAGPLKGRQGPEIKDEGTPFAANRALATLRVLINGWLDDEDLSLRNPCAGVKANREQRRERYLTADEVARVWAALDALEKTGPTQAQDATGRRVAGRFAKRDSVGGITRHQGALFRLLLLTGCRVGEILGARWEWLRWDEGALDLPDSKTGRKIVVLPTAALDLLRALGPKPAGFIIEGEVPGKPANNVRAPWLRVCAVAGIGAVRIHDLRHSVASHMVQGNASLAIVGRALGHSQPATTARYAHLSTNPVREALDRANARMLAGVGNGKTTEGEVGK